MRKLVAALMFAVPLSLGASVAAHAGNVVFSGVGPTTQDYQMAVAWSNLLAAAKAKTQMTVVDNGSAKGLRLLAQDRVDIVAIGAPHYEDAVKGEGKFKRDPKALIAKYKNMSVLFAITTSAAQYVARVSSGIKTIPDFKGKALAIGRPGGNAGRVTTALFQTYGVDLTKGDANGQYLKYGPALKQMEDGNLDATLVWGGIPQAAIENASRLMKLRFVSPDPSKLQAFRNNISNGKYYVFQKVPAAVIKQAYGDRVVADGPAYFWTFPFMMVVRNDMPNDVAYELVKTFWNNIKKVNAMSPALALITKEGALQALSAKIHPGAAKYYREVGMLK